MVMRLLVSIPDISAICLKLTLLFVLIEDYLYTFVFNTKRHVNSTRYQQELKVYDCTHLLLPTERTTR